MTAMITVTLKEAVRKKTFIVMTILSGLYLVLWTVLLYFSKREMNDQSSDFSAIADLMLSQMGLQFSSMLISLLTIMLAAGSISNEMETGMVHAIISRPIRRVSYVLGRFSGLMILSAVYATVLFSALLLIGRAFSLQTVLSLGFGQTVLSWLLYTLVPVCLLCITMYGSTLLKTVPNGLLMIFLYILGNIGGMVEMIGGYMNNNSVVSSGIFISLLSPFHTLYTESSRILFPGSGIASDLMRGMSGLSGSGRAASTLMFIYIGVYAVGFLLLAARRFHKKDI